MPIDPPPEIWTTILEYVPKRSLMTVRTLSSSFYNLSSLLLYRQFDYRPKTDAYNRKTNKYEDLDGLVDREMARLAFWSLDKVSPHVRACNISHAGYALKPLPPLLYLIDVRTPLGDTLFDTISRFSNLTDLYFDYSHHPIKIPPLPLANLPNLQKLHICGALLGDLDGQPTSTSYTISAPHFSYLEIPLHPWTWTSRRSSYLSLLNPVALRSLELSAGDGLDFKNCILDTATMASFHNLKALSLSLSQPDFPLIYSAVATFPAIEELILDVTHPREGDLDTVPPAPLAPQLLRYRGPAAFLPLAFRGSHPTQLAVTDEDGMIEELLRILTRSGFHANSITVLAIRVTLYADICESDALQELLSLFPHLERLAIQVSSDKDPVLVPSDTKPHTAPYVCDRLGHILASPPTLQTVVFRWRLAKSEDDELIPDLSQLTARLREEHSTLKVIFSKSSGGRLGLGD
ncbi:hypothetical protein K438DRAFT_1779018 [Mycena galopus ATCC 62051]|nr:hypothetical protein K438DRAFT_1779018 [Mycena galopus ATCC 62051]